MKKLLALIPILFSLNLAHGNSRYVTLTDSNQSESVLATDLIKIVGANEMNLRVKFDRPDGNTFSSTVNRSSSSNTSNLLPVGKHLYTGVVRVSIIVEEGAALTLKITPAATTVTTSKPVMVPPTSASDDTVNVQLQVSTDLKNWEDVAPGEFLGSDAVRFFRIKTTSGNPE